jgi:tRNA(His) 5'-end guanylyltransferase
MNLTLLERLRGFQIPAATPLSKGSHLVARLQGVDFEGLLDSPDFDFTRPFDEKFGKMMVKTASYLLGPDACGRYGYIEQNEFSMLLDQGLVAQIWKDANELQNYLVALCSSKMSLILEDEALFSCRLYSFSKPDLVIAYFVWRQQEAYLKALDRYCTYVLSESKNNPKMVASILDGLGPLEKEEILHQNGIDYSNLPAWQRRGASISLTSDGKGVRVDTNLPEKDDYRPYLSKYLE